MNPLLLSILTTLLLIGCSKASKPVVFNLRGKTMGEIHMTGMKQTSIVDAYGRIKGTVSDHIITDPDGVAIGSIRTRDGEILILNANGTAAGSLQDGTDCYGSDQNLLGRVSTRTDSDAAGAACLLLILKK